MINSFICRKQINNNASIRILPLKLVCVIIVGPRPKRLYSNGRKRRYGYDCLQTVLAMVMIVFKQIEDRVNMATIVFKQKKKFSHGYDCLQTNRRKRRHGYDCLQTEEKV